MSSSADLLVLLNKLNPTEFPGDYVFENTEVMFDDDDIIGIFLPGRKLTGPFQTCLRSLIYTILTYLIMN
jgi:hypothetical protein